MCALVLLVLTQSSTLVQKAVLGVVLCVLSPVLSSKPHDSGAVQIYHQLFVFATQFTAQIKLKFSVDSG